MSAFLSLLSGSFFFSESGPLESLVASGSVGAFFITFLQERVGRRPGERDQVDRGGRLHVGERLVKPVVGRARVRRGEEVKIFAAVVEDRLANLGESVGQGVRLVGIDRIEQDCLKAGAVDE